MICSDDRVFCIIAPRELQKKVLDHVKEREFRITLELDVVVLCISGASYPTTMCSIFTN